MDVSVGDSLLFVDSRGRVSIAVNQGKLLEEVQRRASGAIFFRAKALLSRISKASIVSRVSCYPPTMENSSFGDVGGHPAASGIS